MTTLDQVRNVLQQFKHRYVVLHSNRLEIIIATAEHVVADLRDHLDPLYGVTCKEYTLRGLASLTSASVVVVLLYIRMDQ